MVLTHPGISFLAVDLIFVPNLGCHDQYSKKREEEYKFRKKTVFYLLAFLHSVFRSDHLQRLRSCALIGPHTSTCPDE